MATNWNAARQAAAEKIVARQVNPTTVTYFQLKDADKLCARIEKAYPDLMPDVKSVENAGVGRDGGPVKLAVYKRGRMGGTPAGNVSLYSSGKAVWTNLEPIGA